MMRLFVITFLSTVLCNYAKKVNTKFVPTKKFLDYKLVYEELADESVSERPFEERIADFIRNDPVIALQCALSFFVLINFLAEKFAVVALKYHTRLRSQSHWLAISAGLIDTLCSVVLPTDLAGYDLLDESRRMIAEFTRSDRTSRRVAYSLIALLIGSTVNSTVPLVVGEFPFMLRSFVLVLLVSFPKDSTVHLRRNYMQWLFGKIGIGEEGAIPIKVVGLPDDKKVEKSLNIDKLFDFLSFFTEVLVFASYFVMLLFRSSSGEVKGIQDISLIVLQVILITTYLQNRTKDVVSTENLAVEKILIAFKSYLPVEYAEHVHNLLAKYSNLRSSADEKSSDDVAEISEIINDKVAKNEASSDSPKTKSKSTKRKKQQKVIAEK